MAAIDSYSACPCGSGEKYKWCCQKAESFVERSTRLLQSGQTDAALKIMDEGLRAAPDNPWLGLRKGLVLLRRDGVAPAYDFVKQLAQRNPKHPGVQSLLLQLASQTEKPSVVAGMLQTALRGLSPENREKLAEAIAPVAMELAEAKALPAALAHLRLAARLAGDDAQTIENSIHSLEADPNISIWLRMPFRLSPVPKGIDAGQASRFESALQLAQQGLWADAAREFDALSKLGTPESDRNLGLCRAWLADHLGAVDALRRYTSWIGPTPDTLALEALCQGIEPLRQEETVEQLQWIWPIRDRAALLETLGKEPRVVAYGKRPLNPMDEASTEVDNFVVLDRPMIDASAPVTPENLPVAEGALLVGQEIAVLEAFDDGRLDRLADWFRAAAGPAIPPAHPRSKQISRAPRHLLALRKDWVLPAGADLQAYTEVLNRARTAFVQQTWPDTPLPALGGRTPKQAVGDKDLELPLRAALRSFDFFDSQAKSTDSPRLDLRSELGITPEPPVDSATFDPTNDPVADLDRVDVTSFDDDRLIAAFRQSVRFGLHVVMERAARALVERPGVFDDPRRISCLEAYSALANVAVSRQAHAEALDWCKRGREALPADQRNAAGPLWDMFEVRLHAAFEPPDEWVPLLVATLDRYRESKAAGEYLAAELVKMGLIQPVRDPDQPDEVYLDTRPLEGLVAKYGPRITTASGELGVSAARPEVWTPDSEASASGGSGLWTPGSDTRASTSGPSKLIIPGR